MVWKWIVISGIAMTLLFSGCKNEENIAEGKENNNEQLVTEEQETNSEKEQLEFNEIEPEIENMGEGAPSAEVVDLQESDSYQIGDTIAIEIEGQTLYELRIDEVSYTDMRDEYTQDPGNVILVTYTYTNLSDEELMIDDMRFQMMLTDESTLLESYYLSDVKVPEPLVKEKSCTAQISYSIDEKIDKAILAYHDTVHMEVVPVKIMVNNLQ